jgi:hypothetical protein
MKKNNKLLIVLAGLILLVLLYIAFVKTPPSMTINQNVSGNSSDEPAGWAGPGFYYGFWFGSALAYTTWANQNYYNHNNNNPHHNNDHNPNQNPNHGHNSHNGKHNSNGAGHTSGSHSGGGHGGNGPRR